MLSYRHAFHAGNHADVFKHTTLLWLLKSLHKKDKAFSLIDTHGGAGLYQLDDEWAKKTGEAENGILRLRRAVAEALPAVPPLVSEYLEFCSLYLEAGEYPGSPEFMRRFLRSGDHLTITELHSTEIEVLQGNLAKLESRAKSAAKATVVAQKQDAYKAITALTPPTPRRGLLLMDPSYEVTNDYENAAQSLTRCHKHWPVGILCLWYPLLHHRAAETAGMLAQLRDAAAASGASYVQAELMVDSPEKSMGLYGSGMAIINAPWQTEEALAETLPFLAAALANTGAPTPAHTIIADRR